MGFRQDYLAGAGVPRRASSARRSSSSPATTTPATSATCTSRSSSGRARRCCSCDDVTIVGVDSSEPDLDHGQIGRARYDVARASSTRAPPASASSCCTTTCCRSRARGASATSSTTPATCSRCCRPAASTSCSPATSTCPTPGGSSGSSSSTPAPARRCACAATPRPATTSSASTATACEVRAQVPLPRHRDAHRVRAVDGVVREVHLSGSSGGRAIGQTLPRAVVVIDGEHYPPVVAAALERLRERYEVVGGALRGRPREAARRRRRRAGARGRLGVPGLHVVDPRGAGRALLDAVRAALREARRRGARRPLGRARPRLPRALPADERRARRGRALRGAPTPRSRPQDFARLAAMPALGVIGTGKRVGKTAVSGWLARRLQARLAPRGRRASSSPWAAAARRSPSSCRGGEGLERRRAARAPRARGRHAASDCYEDAALAGVTADRLPPLRRRPGRRALRRHRARGAAARGGERRGAGVIEGSGAVVPPVACDATLCVVGRRAAGRLRRRLPRYVPPAPERRARAHAVRAAVRRGRRQVAALVAAARAVQPGLEVVTDRVPAAARAAGPRPHASPSSRRRPPAALPRARARRSSEDHGAEVVLAAADLADRARLADGRAPRRRRGGRVPHGDQGGRRRRGRRGRRRGRQGARVLRQRAGGACEGDLGAARRPARRAGERSERGRR